MDYPIGKPGLKVKVVKRRIKNIGMTSWTALLLTLVFGRMAVGQDCQPNGVSDETDIANGTSPDLDENGIPDECCPISVVYVDADAPGVANGSSWRNAYRSLQDALAVQRNCSTLVRVAQGTYKPDVGSGQIPGRRTATFRLNGFALYGGYAGYGAENPDSRDPYAHPTILSGEIAVPVWDNDNSFHVVTAEGPGATVMVDGFTIRGGYSDYDSTRVVGGAGVLVLNARMTIRNCSIIENRSIHYYSWGGGSGLYCTGGHIMMERCRIVQNRSVGPRPGGGLLSINCTVHIVETDIAGNLIDNPGFGEDTSRPPCGGGIASYGGELVVRNSRITDNQAGDGDTIGINHACGMTGGSGGGVYVAGEAIFVNSLFWGNRAGDGGRSGDYNSGRPCESGGPGGSGGGIGGTGEIVLQNCTFGENRAGLGTCGTDECAANGVGDGVAIQNGRFTNCSIWNTVAGTSSFRFCNLMNPLQGVGNISSDLSIEPEALINAGDPVSFFEPGATDLLGNPRVLCGCVDIGAYELGADGCGGLVRVSNYPNWLSCFTGPDQVSNRPGCEAFDFDADGDVDSQDFQDAQNGFAPPPIGP